MAISSFVFDNLLSFCSVFEAKPSNTKEVIDPSGSLEINRKGRRRLAGADQSIDKVAGIIIN